MKKRIKVEQIINGERHHIISLDLQKNADDVEAIKTTIKYIFECNNVWLSNNTFGAILNKKDGPVLLSIEEIIEF
ncbi:MAG: hypothetical protein ACOCP4_00695 [Candidatus Woesearchaeota archaeon]